MKRLLTSAAAAAALLLTGGTAEAHHRPRDSALADALKSVMRGRMACGGITGLPAPGGSAYELGGVALIDLHRRTVPRRPCDDP